MNTRNTITAALILSLLAGCGLMPERKPVDYKNGGTPAPALEVPPDLTMPAASQRYSIPADDGTKVANYSDYTRDVKQAEAPCAAPAPTPVATPVVADKVDAPRLLTVEGTRFVLLADPFDRAWRKVGLALERAKIVAGDVNRSKGVFYLKSSDKQPSELRVLVRETQGVTVVTVEAEKVAQAEAARVLDAIYPRLEK